LAEVPAQLPDARAALPNDRTTAMAESGPDVPDDLVAVGRISGAYGIKGGVRVAPYNDPEQSVLCVARDWWLAGDRSSGRGVLPARAGPYAVRVESARVHSDSIVCRIRGVEDREQAERLKGSEISVRRSAFPAGAEDEVYWTDLVGCRVRNADGTDLGLVTAVDEYGADPVLRVAYGDGQVRLIPFVPAWIRSVDTGAREIVADWQPDY
jgi:16S rRNA processing protein RimM